ncbi:MAG: antiterminator LoaP [Spirochaetales bacterium]|nr:antiterminator LoaP [Spirochaetales bacterium]
MNYFVLKVKNGKEADVLSRSRELFRDEDVTVFWFRRELQIRKSGAIKNVLSPLFPGYLIIQASSIAPQIFRKFREIPGFSHFLKSNTNISCLSGRDRELILHFIRCGETIAKSMVLFTPNQPIKILSGPLKGLEGMIIKVDKRKKRIKVRLALYKDSFCIDFGFESVEAAPQTGDGK